MPTRILIASMALACAVVSTPAHSQVKGPEIPPNLIGNVSRQLMKEMKPLTMKMTTLNGLKNYQVNY